MRRFAAFLALVLMGASIATAAPEAGALIAVASNFKEAQDALAKRFEEKTGHRIESVYSSTGKIYAQTTFGAPYDAFLSADTKHVDLLIEADLALKPTRFTYAVGRLALYSTHFEDMSKGAALLDAPGIVHVAMANPGLAPYGLAASQTLEKLNAWKRLQPKLVQGENIAQAFQYVKSGAAELGFVALSQVIKLDTKRYWPVPPEFHDPIRQDGVVLAHGKENPVAQAYLEFLKGDDARDIIRRFGYALDGDGPR
ncbi:MAG: molybdate ABC transporter substrate-binding protein [Candidatus Hydrogenedentales bacterium]